MWYNVCMKTQMESPSTCTAELAMIGNRVYEEGKDAHIQRIESLAWVINGKRILADRSDVELLEKFMKGNVYLRDGSDGDSISMKSQLPRLRELLGEPKK